MTPTRIAILMAALAVAAVSCASVEPSARDGLAAGQEQSDPTGETEARDIEPAGEAGLGDAPDADGTGEATGTAEGTHTGNTGTGSTGSTSGGGAPAGGSTGNTSAGSTAPRITIVEPKEGATVSGSVTVRGEASVYEATVILRLRDPSGAVVFTTFTTATDAAPARGTWSITIEMPSNPSGTWTIEAVEESAEDGSDSFVATRRVRVA